MWILTCCQIVQNSFFFFFIKNFENPPLPVLLTSWLPGCLPCSRVSLLSPPPLPGMPEEQRAGLQEELIDIILVVLERNPQLHYYQGYHDIVVTFLLVVGERLATSLVEKLSTHHLRYPRVGREEGHRSSGPPEANPSTHLLAVVFSGWSPVPPAPPLSEDLSVWSD